MSAEDKLERMRRTKEGWGKADFEALYLGFGFEQKKDGIHDKYFFREFQLMATVARHNKLPRGYAVTAVKLIDRLLAEQARVAEEERLAQEARKAIEAEEKSSEY